MVLGGGEELCFAWHRRLIALFQGGMKNAKRGIQAKCSGWRKQRRLPKGNSIWGVPWKVQRASVGEFGKEHSGKKKWTEQRGDGHNTGTIIANSCPFCCYFQCTRNCAEHSGCIASFSPYNNPMGQDSSIVPTVWIRKLRPERLYKLSNITQLWSGGTWAYLSPEPMQQLTNKLFASQCMESNKSIVWLEHRACGKEEWQLQPNCGASYWQPRSGGWIL